MQRHNITFLTRRMAILAFALLTFCLPSLGDVPTKSTPQKGTGTEANTYLISNVNEFMFIKDNPGLVYKQTADLDFTGYEFDSSNGNSVVNANFTGTYDGNGHTIKNVTIDWSKKYIVDDNNKTHSYIGIFRTIGQKGKVRNLILDNITLKYNYSDKNNLYHGTDDELGIEIGILSGNAYKNAEIENIIVKNSIINATGDPNATNYFVGGLVGDVRENSTTTNGVTITIKNISVSIDIFLPDCTRNDYVEINNNAARPHQFFVGGIVGRLRTANSDYYPINTFFTGEIKAPIAMIGPCYGGGRYAQSNTGGGYFTSVYAGQIADPDTPGNTNPKDKSVMGMTGTGTPDANRYFNNYKVWHYDEDASGNLKCEEVTGSVPSNTNFLAEEQCYYGTRTFRPNYPYSNTTKVEYKTAKGMASFQGVNHGTYSSDNTTLLNMFNKYVDENTSKSLKQWYYIQGHGFDFSTFAIVQTGFDTVTPRFSTNAGTNLDDYKIKWTLTKSQDNSIVTMSKNDASPLCFTTDLESTLNDINRYKSVKAELINGDGNTEFTSEINLPDIDCLIFCRSQGNYLARVRNSWPEIMYRFRWHLKEGDTELQNKLSDLTREDEFSIPIYSSADNIVVEICDKDGNVYYYHDGTPAIINLDITAEAPNAKVVLKREKDENNTTYFVVYVYLSDDLENPIAGGCPFTNSTNYKDNTNVQYVWECTTDASDTHNFTQISNTESYFKGYMTETYYKVTAYYNGWELAYAFCGNKDVIFVYDKTKHAEAETLINETYTVKVNNEEKTYNAFDTSKPITSFDGKDKWTDIDGEHEDDFSDGDDTNDGRNPDRAVKSLEQAYKLLDPKNGPDDNIIVVMGFNYDRYLFDWTRDKAKYDEIYNKAATITGKYGKISGGAIVLANHSSNPIGLRGATKFENISLVCIPSKAINAENSNTLFLYANLHDLTFGENVVMRGYVKDSGDHGLIDTDVPNITIVGGVHNFDVANGDISSYREKCTWNQDKDFTTITIQSGCFSRIMGGSRNDGNPNANSHNIFGNNTLPHRVKIIIAIKHNVTGENIFKEYCPDITANYDIGLLAGGQTDGSVYSEAELSMEAGTVGRFISGNITFCRVTDVTTNDVVTSYYPYDSYFGSTVFNFRGGDIKELYGGSLGRIGGGTTGDLKAYFYGRSIINIEGGTISSSLCGASAGGVSGVGTDLSHTDDNVIPYIEDNDIEDNVLKYGDYNASKGKVAKMTLSDGSILDFNKTYCEVNVKSGTVNGNIYGAGGGESSVIGNSEANRKKLSSMAGWLFGDCLVSITEDEGCTTLINGNVYGAGMGSKKYYSSTDGDNEFDRKGSLAQLHGNSRVEISGGTIIGNVFAAGKGIASRYEMAAMYGKPSLVVTGGTILGNIYGGSQLADLRRFELSEAEATAYSDDAYSEGEGTNKKYYLKGSGDTNVIIDGGVIGNCIFGGSEGLYVNASSNHKSTIEGDTHVTVNGGEFLDTPYIDTKATDATVPADWNVEDTPENYRNFNIYGGGNVNCDISGTAYVKMYTSLLTHESSFVPKSQNPNALTEHATSERFHSAYMDITYRRFCVYGGGYGVNTTVGNTDVYVTIPPDRMGVTLPHGNTLDSYLPNQSFFDIAGGGYSGDVGYWVDKEGKKVKDYTKDELKTIRDDSNAGAIAALYHTYINGNCKVTIDGYTYARKIIGGGFYGSCNNTNTHVRCGSLRQVYGGSLLGDVHQRAFLQFGNRIEDFIRKVGDSYVYDENGLFSNEGEEYQGDKANASSVWSQAAARAKALNDYIYITENIYGGNDVKGIIGTKKWEAPSSTASAPVYALATNFVENTYQETIYPLFCTDDSSTKEDCGIVFNIYGGTFMGDVYGAGNGHYRGYYVPEWVRYTDGPSHLYRKVKSGIASISQTQKVYNGRPMVGNVNINIRGNSENDKIHFTKNFYGGGRECTIGQWNTLLPVEDPRRLVQGGHLHVNFGGYTDIDGNVYMGSEGSLYATQPVVPEGVNFSIYNTLESKKTENIDKLEDIAYYHWYYDNTDKRYLPGFPPKGKTDGNYGITGEHMFRAYLKNIEMECDVELTFYRNLYERDEDNKFIFETVGSTPIEDAYRNKLRKRKRWIPYEMAVADVTPSETTSVSYDAPSITMTSFFLGGACGSMSNNNVMDYAYDATNYEKYPAIYRVSLPKGVLIKDAVVMGSQDAEIEAYKYTDSDCKTITKNGDNLLYSYQGGMVTHSSIAFDLIVYNDKYHPNDPKRDLPVDFYTNDSNDDGTEDYISIRNITTSQEYTLLNGPDANTKIKRKNYSTGNTALSVYYGSTTNKNNSENIQDGRYDFTVLKSNNNTAYIGPRAKREGSSDHLTVVKLGASCTFVPQLYDPTGTLAGASEDEKHANRYGGIIYGGCYSSGITIGDVVLNVASDMLGAHYDINSSKAYGEFSRLKYNKGRVFGGGFGPNTEVQGNTYVNLINEFRGMNVFGGGMQGNVTGTANVTYIGEETRSYVYGAIYGGGLRGYVGDPNNISTNATVVSLYSGNVDKVYGGSCMGDLYGYAYVELTDKVQSDLDHLDYDRLKDKGYDWTDSRLIAGTVYGGNDITGNIYYDTTVPLPEPVTTATGPKGPKDYAGYTTAVYVHEVKDTDAKTTPGSDEGYNGFPLIGTLYGGSNGNYGVHGTAAADGTVHYTGGQVCLATGNKTDSLLISLNSRVVPTIDKAMVDVRGGTIIDAYTGGNMATLTKNGKIYVNYRHPAARAGFEKNDELRRMWNALHLSSEMQLDEVIKDYYTTENNIFEFNIFRLFGGNDNADMAIQPDVDLQKGEIGSVYSGGNFGAMTFYQPHEDAVAADPENGVEAKAEVPEAGLTLTINSNDITINNVYGGGRLGDINPNFASAGLAGPTNTEAFYGATLNINGGKIQHIYGGNDVAGYIYNGTNVNIHGAIAGDVYCAGNGDYTYKYDREANLCNYPNPKILEDYEVGDNTKGERYFTLPAKSEYGYTSGSAYNPTDAQVIMAINSYRPHVERAKLTISGSDANHKVWVGGNVYCGGNSATVTKKATGYDVIFNIGNYVTLNGVFLGSNGENLALGSTIQKFEKFNDIDITEDNDLTTDKLPAGADQTAVTAKETLYPKLLDLYMRAVETTQQPEGFKFKDDPTEAYIGEFCVGGNRGSIMTDKRISIDFPEKLNIYGRIIGGSKNANVTYNGATHIGGLTVPLAPPTNSTDPQETVKVELKVRSKFLPLQAFEDTLSASGYSLRLCMVDTLGAVIAPDDIADFKKTKYYKDKQCNVYGGCFTSGKTVGGINIDLYSDMINYAQIDDDYKTLAVDVANSKEANIDHPEYIDRQAIINDIMHPESWRNFTIVGAGYGADTEVWGNINVRLLPTVSVTGEGESAVRNVTHPSVGTIFGGSQEGLVVGNTNVEIRDGRVFANVYGASEAAQMYGSTSVIVGYPRYYRALQSGNYRIKRADYMSDVAVNDLCDEFGEVVVPKAVSYLEGEIVPENVYEMILGRIKDSRIQTVIDDSDFKQGKSVKDEYVDLISTTNPITNYFEPVKSEKTNPSTSKLYDHIVPEDFGATWDDIEIWVGDQNSNNDPDRKYFGQGNIYGGGYIPNSSDRTLIGQPTIMRFTKDYHNDLVQFDETVTTSSMSEDKQTVLREKFTALYGGNTSVIMWDNEENATMADDDSRLKDHVHIGTGYFKNVSVTTKSSAKGLFKKLASEDAYIYQTVGKVDPDALNRYYEKIADGGVYGGGRKVFAQAFRSIDLAYYGYAEHTPQKPKLLNTIQRADFATIRDCCMDLVGASDFTLSDFKNIYYAINRVGELRMYSSLSPFQNLDVGTIDSTTGDGIRMHKTKRSRNFIALYNRTNHLGAFRSNWTFEDIYHLADGTGLMDEECYEVDETTNKKTYYGYPTDYDNPSTDYDNKVSYVNRKHRYIDLYTKYHELYMKDEKYWNALPEDRTNLEKVSEADITILKKLYKACTGKEIDDDSETTVPETTDPENTVSGASRTDNSSLETATEGVSLLTDYIKNKIEDVWKQRNVGTSGNMIGISSGYELSIEGLACQRKEATESRYYGPAYGVTEIKILTTVSGMGGGYIYALNHHYDPEIDGAQAETQTSGWCSKFGRDFLNTTGNFVFPGADYTTTVDGDKTTKRNYIIDDCFDHYDPINHGYFECEDMGGHERVITKAPPRKEGESESGSVESGSSESGSGESGSGSGTTPFDVNNAHEIHYWYVSGNTYVYNVTITGITSDTTPEDPRNFYIDNTNGLVNLFNIKEGTTVWVDDVTWFEHEGSGIEDCDLTHHEEETIEGEEGEESSTKEYLSTQYKLYLTVFDNTRNTFTDEEAHQGAYAIRIPRHSYLRDDNASSGLPINKNADYPDRAFVTGEDVEVHPNMGVDGVIVNDYKDKYTDSEGKEATNHPLLGVRLVDGQKNRLADQDRQAGIDYFNKHLAGDHNVQVTLYTRNGSDEPITYIINIDIRYLMGPALFGQIEIENCALPGEYIYVNANDVEVLMDENLGVSKQTWRMYPNVDGQRVKVETDAAKAAITDPEVKYDTDNIAYYDLDKDPYTISTTDKVIHIPGYLYHNGWEVAYEVVANGEYFESVLPYYGTKADPEDATKTVTDYEKILHSNRLQVHNYHRMKPVYNEGVLDLHLTEDSRIYIENQADMDYFFDYLYQMQGTEVPEGYKRFTLPTGKVVNPRYCTELNFYQTAPLNVPTIASPEQLIFEGNYHGMGNNMTIPNGERYSFINKGRFYNVGFISNSTDKDSHAFSENQGSLYNCFYFNTYGKGSFLGVSRKSDIAAGHEIVNCYENTLTQDKLTELGYSYNEILHLSTMGFKYGQAAYNLNGYYLMKRHVLLHGPSATDSWSTENNSFALKEKDVELRGNATNYTPYEVPYVEKLYNNGDYRYAFVTSSTFPETLRTEAEPNYLDRLNNRKNEQPVSMHDATPDAEGKGLDGHRADMSRWCDNHKEYHPQFDTDYLFFGQKQTIDVDEYNTTLPCAVTADTRVYRVGGFYGNAADKGYYFNRHAYLDSPVMTAVDFVGYRDRDLYDTDGKLKAADRADIDDNGWVIKNYDNQPFSERNPESGKFGGWQEVYCPPTLDLPWVMVGDTPMHDFDKFTLIDSKVTHNLLVYTRDNDKAAGYLTDYHYDGDFVNTQFQYHSDEGIKLHHIVDRNSVPVMYGDYFHLVDGYDFNAPVAFKVKQGWYTRKPNRYADVYVLEGSTGTEECKTGWETICLPFDVAKTYAATTDQTKFKEDMGEITHFFGEEYKGHEYWLRRLTGYDSADSKLQFERPKESNRQGTIDDKVGDLKYDNSMLHDLYLNAEYQEGHDELYHNIGEWPRTIKDYRYLTGGVPYIVTYPGQDFYEFDLSGNFYADFDTEHRAVVPQSISYFVMQKNDETYVEIPITDTLKGGMEYTGGDYKMVGTFAHATNVADKANESVLYTYVDKLWIVNDDGTEFKKADDGSEVLPFRAYVTKGSGSKSSRGLLIGGDIVNYNIDDAPEVPDEEEPDLDENVEDNIRVWTSGNSLFIYTPYDLATEIYNTLGQRVQSIRAYKGTNRYSGLSSGFYIVLRTKVHITNQ